MLILDDSTLNKFKNGIAFLSFCPVIGGVSTYQANQLNWLAGQIDLALIDEFPENTLMRLDDKSSKTITSIQVPLWSKPWQVQRELVKWAGIYRPKVIALSNPGVLVKYHLFLMYARKKLGAKILLTHHSGLFDLRRLYLEMISSISALNVDDLVYVSAFTRRYWEQRYPWMRRIPSRIVHNGVPISSESPLVHQLAQPLRVGFVGRLSFEKDPELFCKVAQLAKRQNLDWEFHIYGDGSLASSLQQQYGSSIFLHGTVADVDTLFRSIDILLITSPIENCPYVLLEAKTFGIPTVSRAVGGIPEILVHGQDGYLSNGHEPEQLLSALKKAALNYAQLSQGCLMRRSSYALGKIAKEMWDRYLV